MVDTPTIKIESGKPIASKGQGSLRPKTIAAVFHHTGGNSLEVAKATLKDRGLAYNYLIDRDGAVVTYMPGNLVAYHAGTKAGSKVTNWNAIGISAVAKDNTEVTQKQVASAINLNKQLSSTFGYSDVYGHGEVNPQKLASEGMSMVSAIRSAGSSGSSMPKAREGGIFSGSELGSPVKAPLDPNSILAKMLTASPSEAAAMMPASSSSDISDEIIASMIRKCDTMISYLSDGVAIEQKILRQS